MENERIKVSSLDIIVTMMNEKPYYEIKYKEIGESYHHIGYSSYELHNVLKWKNECFEIVSETPSNEEKQGLLLKLPCRIGSDVYIVPSETNFRRNIFAGFPKNNRVFHQKVALITFTENGWYMEGDIDREYFTCRTLPENKYKETWFLSREEAETKLKEMEGRVNGNLTEVKNSEKSKIPK